VPTKKAYAGECWRKPGSKKALRAEKTALKAFLELSQLESGEDSGSEVEASDDKYACVSLLPPSSRVPRTCRRRKTATCDDVVFFWLLQKQK
jgi:hypothetical protein